MTTEQLRNELIKGTNDLLEAPVVKRLISAERKRLLRAQRRFWELADELTLIRLNGLLEQEPRQDDELKSNS